MYDSDEEEEGPSNRNMTNDKKKVDIFCFCLLNEFGINNLPSLSVRLRDELIDWLIDGYRHNFDFYSREKS